MFRPEDKSRSKQKLIANYKSFFITMFAAMASLLVLLAMAGFCSSIVRVLTGLTLETSFFVAFVVVIPVAIFSYAVARECLEKWPALFAWLPIILLGFLFVLRQLYNPDFEGFPSFNVSDGANHEHYKRMFGTTDSTVYNGFVTLYSTVIWIERLFNETPFFSFRTTFYFTIALMFLTTAVVGVLCANVVRLDRKQLLSMLITSSYLMLVLHFVVLPPIQQAQGDGYFAQIFGFVPLFAIWCSYVAIETRWLRIATLLCGAVLYRFTYGLNLADYLFCAAILIGIETPHVALRQVRGLCYLLAFVVAALALYCAYRVSFVFSIWGAVVKVNLKLQGASLVILSVLFLCEVIYLAKTKITALIELQTKEFNSQRFSRALLFPALFSLCSVLFLCSFNLVGVDGKYYPYKYYFQAFGLAWFVSVIFVYYLCNVAQSFVSSRLNYAAVKMVMGVILALGLAGAGNYQAILKTRASYLERAERLAVYRWTRPLDDVVAEEIIKGVLDSERKTFGGLIISHWPLYSFMNTTLGLYLSYDDYVRGKLIQEPGYCVFWQRGQERKSFAKFGGYKTIKKIDKLEKEGEFRSISYQDRHSKKDKLLAYRCY